MFLFYSHMSKNSFWRRIMSWCICSDPTQNIWIESKTYLWNRMNIYGSVENLWIELFHYLVYLIFGDSDSLSFLSPIFPRRLFKCLWKNFPNLLSISNLSQAHAPALLAALVSLNITYTLFFIRTSKNQLNLKCS